VVGQDKWPTSRTARASQELIEGVTLHLR